MNGYNASRCVGMVVVFGVSIVAAPVPDTAPRTMPQRFAEPYKGVALDDIPDTRVSVVLARLGKELGVKIDLDVKAFERVGVRNPAAVRPRHPYNTWGPLYRILRRVAVSVHPCGALDFDGDRVILTTTAELKASGRKPARFPTTEPWLARQRATEAKLDAKADLDFSDVDPKDAKVGNFLDVIAKRFRFQYDLRTEVFALYGDTPAASQSVRLPAGEYRGTVRACIEGIVRQLKTNRDEVLVMVGQDGTVVITTKKYKDDPIPPEAIKPAD